MNRTCLFAIALALLALASDVQRAATTAGSHAAFRGEQDVRPGTRARRAVRAHRQVLLLVGQGIRFRRRRHRLLLRQPLRPVPLRRPPLAPRGRSRRPSRSSCRFTSESAVDLWDFNENINGAQNGVALGVRVPIGIAFDFNDDPARRVCPAHARRSTSHSTTATHAFFLDRRLGRHPLLVQLITASRLR